MSRVALAKIPSLTFYKDALTTSRRGQEIAQLNCIGKACQLYEPEVVRCVNLGGHGTDVDWKCEADLPEALRFGRIEVSCEGWDGPGDPYVSKSSCALNYRLVQVPDALRGGESHSSPSRLSRWFATQDVSSIMFMIIWIAVLLFLLYTIVKTCWEGRSGGTSTPRPHRRGPGGPGPGSGWFPGSYRNDRPGGTDAPPPYTKYPNSSTPAAAQEPGWRPGFWTGAAVGGLGTYLFNRNREQGPPRTRMAYGTRYDWEQPSTFSTGYRGQPRMSSFGSNNRGEGSSNLGPTRRSTGIGGSSVR